MRARIFSAIYFLRRSVLGRGLERFAGLKRLYRYFLQNRNLPTQLLVTAQGNKFFLDPRDAMSKDLLSHGVWEEYETQIFKETISPGDVVLDIGANIGYYSLIAARLVGDTGKVHAFEPEPNSRDLLEKNIAVNKCSNIVCIGVVFPTAKEHSPCTRKRIILAPRRSLRTTSSAAWVGQQ